MYSVDEIGDPRDEADQVAEHREAEAPQHRADEVVERVPAPRHVPDARGDRRERAHDRHEAGQDDRQAAEALEERVRALDVLHAEDAGLLALEHRRSALVADEIADFAADEGRQGDQQRDDPDVDAEDVARVRQQTRDHQQRVAGQQEADQQAGLGEDDEAHHEKGPGAGRGDDRLGVEPGDECDVVQESSRRSLRSAVVLWMLRSVRTAVDSRAEGGT